MIDERLLGHFGLSPHVEPLDEPLVDIMFKKYFRDLILPEGPLPPVPPREKGLCLPLGGHLLKVLPRGPEPARGGLLL
ncbi:UNVERIFIED_CONTAM: hypothetical protein Slati_3500700 [Sesamum latifolium]|uniref:Uncharacterized protein n=1 Tax=Sesamum latifolium TaxID=2727402 RepID=A0AAW2UJB4_9LAMI